MEPDVNALFPMVVTLLPIVTLVST